MLSQSERIASVRHALFQKILYGKVGTSLTKRNASGSRLLFGGDLGQFGELAVRQHQGEHGTMRTRIILRDRPGG